MREGYGAYDAHEIQDMRWNQWEGAAYMSAGVVTAVELPRHLGGPVTRHVDVLRRS